MTGTLRRILSIAAFSALLLSLSDLVLIPLNPCVLGQLKSRVSFYVPEDRIRNKDERQRRRQADVNDYFGLQQGANRED